MLSRDQRMNGSSPDPEESLTVANIEYHQSIVSALSQRRQTLDIALSQMASHSFSLTAVARTLVETLRVGNKVLVAGNGGSAAEAQHFAAELVGRFKRERSAYAVLALTTDTAILTAVANDYGYQEVFARQVEAFGRPDDLLIAFSTSGESENLLQAAQMARGCGMRLIAITGERNSRLEQQADLTVRVPTIDTALAQELHMMITHILCDIVERELTKTKGEAF